VVDVLDFIYLDIERVRSFVAQGGGGGVPTERTAGHEHQAGGQAGASGGIPLIVHAEGQADYRYVRSSTETRSVQDAIFREFQAACLPMLLPDDAPWPTSGIADGQLVSVNGYVKLVDYQASLQALSTFPKLLPAYERFVRASSASPTSASGRPVAAHGLPSKGVLDTIGPLVDMMTKIAGTSFADFVRIKVVPDLSRPNEAFVGDGHRDCFRYSSTILTTLYPGGLAKGWQLVGVVHRATKESLPASEESQTMGDMLESILDQMGGLAAFRQAARPPEIAVTPLAIYRRLIPG
jgi:hypothetical protein